MFGLGGDTVTLYYANNLALWFTKVSETEWVPELNVLSSLKYDPVKHEFVLTGRDGGQTLFFDSSAGARIGMFKGLRNPIGDEFLAVLDAAASNRIVSISRTLDGKVSGIFYEYIPAGSVGAGLLASVTLRVNDVDVRKASYAYYANGDLGGSALDLKRVFIEQFDTDTMQWGDIKRTWYRYYIAGETFGFAHGLKFGSPLFGVGSREERR